VEAPKTWTRAAVRAELGGILAETLGVDPAAVVDAAALVRDLGAESIDFLDLSFRCQQVFGVEVPARLLQERVVEWRDLRVLARVVAERYGLAVSAEELRTVAPATVAAVLAHLAARHGIARTAGDERALAQALARHLLASLDDLALDLGGLSAETLAPLLERNLHAPEVMAALLDRFTVGALARYLADRLAAAGRLTEGG
jgi:acyl carrier protein